MSTIKRREGNGENGGERKDVERDFRPPVLSSKHPVEGKTPGALEQVFYFVSHTKKNNIK